MSRLFSSTAQKQKGRNTTDEGIDYQQLCCAILYNELTFLRYAAESDKEDQGRCLGCRGERPKWGTCPTCQTESYYVYRLVEVTTFFESEFALLLCEWANIDYKAYIDKSKELFLEIPAERRLTALKGAAEWWTR